MKKLIYLLFIAVFAFSCEDIEDVVYDNNGQTGVGFQLETVNTVVSSNSGATVTIPVQSTVTSSSDRSFDVSVNLEESNGTADNYSIGSVVIPANSYEGNLVVNFTDNSLVEFEEYLLVIDLALPSGAAVVGAETVEITYLKAIVCNDVTLTINEDAYADERDWNITDSDGNIVVQCSDYADCPGGQPSGSVAAAQYVYNFTLADGCYTFNISDSYGDGQFDGTTTGNYSLKCSIIVHAENEGDWGSEDSTDFCVNP